MSIHLTTRPLTLLILLTTGVGCGHESQPPPGKTYVSTPETTKGLENPSTPNLNAKTLERHNIRLSYSESVSQEVAEKVLDSLETNKYWKILIEDLEWGKEEPGTAIVRDLGGTYEFTMIVSSADSKTILDDEFGFKMGAIMVAWDIFPGSDVKFRLSDKQLKSVRSYDIPAEK